MPQTVPVLDEERQSKLSVPAVTPVTTCDRVQVQRAVSAAWAAAQTEQQQAVAAGRNQVHAAARSQCAVSLAAARAVFQGGAADLQAQLGSVLVEGMARLAQFNAALERSEATVAELGR